MAEPEGLETPLLQPGQAAMGDNATRRRRLEDDASASGAGCPNCCFGRPRKELGLHQRQALLVLRDGPCNEAFDAESPDNDRLLVEIWNSAFPRELIQKADPSPRWPRLGFQSSNPRTDVRTGCFALKQLHYLFTKYPEKAQQLVRQAETMEYPLAITCFNLTHMVIVFFDLYNSETISPVSGAVRADLFQLDNFAKLCVGQEKIVVDELFCVLIEKLHLIWKDMRALENVNLMAFPKAMRKIFDVHAEFWTVPRTETAEFGCMLADQSL